MRKVFVLNGELYYNRGVFLVATTKEKIVKNAISLLKGCSNLFDKFGFEIDLNEAKNNLIDENAWDDGYDQTFWLKISESELIE